MEHEVGTKGPRGRSVNLRTRQYTDGIIHVPAPCFSVCGEWLVARLNFTANHSHQGYHQRKC
ncbi:Putative protein of unknown function [Podospora comata]|uniref:Uncharacterized protein n=1 Tax=Podospora comata TaxID=48703 RepID=A0ABY6S7B6_PODCO|nr:Putative protein of unknown function [Podospora comata]